MRSGNGRMDYCQDDKEIDHSGNIGPGRSVRNLFFDRSGLVWIIVIALAMVMSAGSVFGQFTVQPMKVEVQVRPGKLIKQAIDVINLDPNEAHTADISVVELSQWENSSWRIIEPNSVNDPNSANFRYDVSKLSSCRSWISLRENTVVIGPLNKAPLIVNIRVERGVRGFYGAGILVTMRPRPDAEFALIWRFLIPIILEIQNRPVRHKVEPIDIGLEAVPATEETPATAMVTMDIENKGGTYSRLKPGARIWAFSDGHWRVITTVGFESAGIIPGTILKLKAKADKYLPSGKYRVAGELYVDGRRTKRIQKEIDFVGDTNIESVMADAPVDLFPRDVIIENMPGGTRAATITVYNASTDTVNVQTALGLQPNLQIAAYGDVKGSDLDCTKWVKVIPEKFTLRGEGGKEVLRVVSTMPNPDAQQHPCYYTLLALWATFPDGQRAGVTTTNICVKNKNKEVAPKADGMKLTLNYLEESKYLVVARFGNFNTMHFTPVNCQAAVTTAQGVPQTGTILGRGKRGLILPMCPPIRTVLRRLWNMLRAKKQKNK